MKYVMPPRRQLTYYIPTRSRPDFKTWDALTPKMRQSTRVVVRFDELNSYLEVGRKVGRIECDYMVLPYGVEGISATRQYILENGDNYVVMIDDDIRNFSWKPNLFSQSLVPAPELVVDTAFEELRLLLDAGYAHVGIVDRPRCGLGNGVYYVENALAMQIIGFNRSIVHVEEKLRFDDVRLAQDKHMTLSLLERGYKNALLAYFTYNCLTTQAAGGCSTFRTEQLINEQALLLQKLHPKTVKVTPKLVKYEGIHATINKVTVQWKKAYQPKSGLPQPNLP